MEQDKEEFFWLKRKALEGSDSILEIGSRNGSSLRWYSYYLQPRAKICSIDYGWAIPNLPDWHTEIGLRKSIDWLNTKGFDAKVYIGDSKTPEAIDWAKDNGPYDFIFIDGDHSYEGVRHDWFSYGSLAPLIGFHDIATEPGVKQLWEEIKQDWWNRTEEINNYCGIGLIHK